MNLQKSIAWGANENPIQLPFELFGKKEVTPEFMSRHILIMGESGSGKTASMIEPILEGLISHVTKEGNQYAGLVIDPKNELREFIQKLTVKIPERVLDLNQSGNIFYGFKGMEKMSVADKLEYLFNMFTSPPSGDNAIFSMSGLVLLRDMGNLEATYFNKTRQSLFTEWLKEVKPDSPDTANFYDGLLFFFESVQQKRTYNNSGSIEKLMTMLAAHDLDSMREATMLKQYEGKGRIVDDLLKQFFYYTSYLMPMLNVVTSKSFRQAVDLNLNMKSAHSIDLESVLDKQRIVIFTPKTLIETDVAIAKILKKQLFDYTFNRQNKKAPLIYIADEFQNFISTDEASGEHNFLDRCRSYRMTCVLATQSYESLQQKAIMQSAEVGASAVKGIINNTSTKVFFKGSNPETEAYVMNLIPSAPVLNALHVVKVRPLTSLRTGECYYLNSDGEWGVQQVNIDDFKVRMNKLKLAPECHPSQPAALPEGTGGSPSMSMVMP
ncbi:MAG: TraM recognition domain-containing protein [Gammaproteobacteria bacterium]|nr:TraM recognition domain-containing protein [Gammaproteobacteria bacterium]